MWCLIDCPDSIHRISLWLKAWSATTHQGPLKNPILGGNVWADWFLYGQNFFESRALYTESSESSPSCGWGTIFTNTISLEQILSAPCIHVYSYNTCMLLDQSIKVDLRILDIHGAKITKNQAPLTRFAWLFSNQTVYQKSERSFFDQVSKDAKSV